MPCLRRKQRKLGRGSGTGGAPASRAPSLKTQMPSKVAIAHRAPPGRDKAPRTISNSMLEKPQLRPPIRPPSAPLLRPNLQRATNPPATRGARGAAGGGGRPQRGRHAPPPLGREGALKGGGRPQGTRNRPPLPLGGAGAIFKVQMKKLVLQWYPRSPMASQVAAPAPAPPSRTSPREGPLGGAGAGGFVLRASCFVAAWLSRRPDGAPRPPIRPPSAARRRTAPLRSPLCVGAERPRATGGCALRPRTSGRCVGRLGRGCGSRLPPRRGGSRWRVAHPHARGGSKSRRHAPPAAPPRHELGTCQGAGGMPSFRGPGGAAAAGGRHTIVPPPPLPLLPCLPPRPPPANGWGAGMGRQGKVLEKSLKLVNQQVMAVKLPRCPLRPRRRRIAATGPKEPSSPQGGAEGGRF
jgi:hypothetical protein